MRTLVLVVLLLLLAGCSRNTSPEQKQADQLLAQAREAYIRNAFQESRSLFRASLVLDEKFGRVPQAAEALERLAAIEAHAGRLDSALALYRAASERHRLLADREAVRLVTLQAAALYRRMGDDRTAHGLLTEALRLALLFKEDEGATQIRWALVGACRALEMEEEEASHLDALLQAAMKSGNGTEQARVYRELGSSAFARNDHPRATEDLLKALTFSGQSHDSLLAVDILYRLAMTYAAAGNIPGAFEAYTDALRRTDVTRGAQRLRYEMLTRIGTTYLGTGSPADAARFYRPALTAAMAAGDKVAEGYLFIQLGHCEARTPGGLENAVRNYRAALELFSAAWHHRGAAYALTSLGAAAERQRQLTEALEYYRQAVAEDERSLDQRDSDDVYIECENTFREDRGPAAEDPLIELLLQLGRSDEAFWFVEQKQARALAEDLGAVQVKTGDPSLDSLFTVWNHGRFLTIGAERQLTTLLTSGPEWQTLLPDVKEVAEFSRRRMEETAAVILQRRPSLAPAVRPSGLAVAEVQRAIPRGSVLVVYAPVSRALYAFLLTPGGNSLQVSPIGRRQLLGQASEFWTLLQLRVQLEDSTADLQRGADRRLLELSLALHGPFMRPVESGPGGLTDLLVILPREFSQLPLQALRRGGAGAQRRFVAEQSFIRYLPSASSLLLAAVTPASQHAVTGMGHPGSTEWDVEYELRDIRAFYKDAVLLFGRDATFEAMKRAGGDILHVTAELRYGRQSAGNSSLLLSDGKPSDGIRAIPWGLLPELPPRAALLISDLGPHLPSKNPLLAQLLMMGGTRSVVLHTFTPLRKSRKTFGEIFYTTLLSGMAPDDAFHRTQLEMIRTSQPLHQWAAFSLWGK